MIIFKTGMHNRKKNRSEGCTSKCSWVALGGEYGWLFYFLLLFCTLLLLFLQWVYTTPITRKNINLKNILKYSREPQNVIGVYFSGDVERCWNQWDILEKHWVLFCVSDSRGPSMKLGPMLPSFVNTLPNSMAIIYTTSTPIQGP